MKKLTGLTTSCAMMLCIFSSPLSAKGYYDDGDFYLGAKFGGALLDLNGEGNQASKQEDNPVNTTTGIVFGYNLNDHLALEADMSYLGRYQSELSDNSDELFSMATYLSTGYHLSDEASLYFKLGTAWVDDELRLSSGLGVRYRLSPNWELDTGYRWIQDTPAANDDLYEFTLGMTYRFGVSRAEPYKPAPIKTAQVEGGEVIKPLHLAEKKRISIEAETLFGFDSDRLNHTQSLYEFVLQLNEVNKHGPVTVTAYTDNVGTKSYNLMLSKRRAESVKRYLISLGLAAESIALNWRGEADPIASNNTLAGRKQNRRVEICIEQ
ncbi:OmpA family protein [Shewanella nanhaiensis]|uniref:OmpA family protein n=1 Tax=Shewanella nanhaiensis TaxID=2864872 RepID=A0ABS7DYW5_9GAMM|nr:OmpA family protein [Shewanella nanhaiensis]MBW8182323.1 OmpA family protein [Shewanella nanhaiensis]